MNSVVVLFGFLIAASVLAISVVVLSLVRLRELRRANGAQQAMRTSGKGAHPSVTVLIDARHASAEATRRTTRALRRCRYPLFDVVVVDEALCQRTKARSVFTAAYRQSQRGTKVLVVMAGDEVDPLFIKRAVIVGAGTEMWQTPLLDALQSSLSLVEMNHLLEKRYWHTMPRARCFTARYFMRHPGKAEVSFRFDDDIRSFIAILLFALLLLAMYVSRQGIVLWYVWILLTGYGMAVVLLYRTKTLRDRFLLLSMVAPFLFLEPVVKLVQGISRFSHTK